MIYQKINLKVNYLKKGISNGGFQPTLTTYVLENHESVDINRKRPFVLICPGGGYGHHSVREAEPIALAMNNAGYHAGVLHYSLAPMDFPSAFFDGIEALKLIRENTDIWNIEGGMGKYLLVRREFLILLLICSISDIYEICKWQS